MWLCAVCVASRIDATTAGVRSELEGCELLYVCLCVGLRHKSYSIYHTLLRTPDVPMLLIRWDASKEGPSSYSQKSNATSQCRGEEDDKRPLRDPMCKRRG